VLSVVLVITQLAYRQRNVEACFSSCKLKKTFIKVKQSHYRPWQALRVPGGWGSQILRQLAYEGGKVVSPTHRPPLQPGNIPGTHSCYRLSRPQGHSRPEVLCQWRIPVTPLGIDPATFRFVARCLNQLRHCVPPKKTFIFPWIELLLMSNKIVVLFNEICEQSSLLNHCRLQVLSP
jgi:hypothetical protein